MVSLCPVLQYTDRISEREFVQHVLQDITAINQRESGTTTSTTHAFSLTPGSIGEWDDNFFTMVLQMSLDSDPKYPRPSSRPVREFTAEANLHEMFLLDVGSVRSLPPFANTLTSTVMPYGNPDLVCSCMKDGSQIILFPIEMKRPLYLHLDDGISYPAAYLQQGSRSQGPAGPLKQIFGYMRLNGYRYGILSTYTQTWVIKRVREHEDDILVSPTIQFNRTEPTLLQCYLWLIRTVDNDVEWQPDIPDEAMVKDKLERDQPKGKDAKRDRDYEPEHANQASK